MSNIYKPEIIIHLGAKSSTDIDDPLSAYQNNTNFTNKLIDFINIVI